MPGLHVAFYNHEDDTFVPVGCFCIRRVSTCIQCAAAIKTALRLIVRERVPIGEFGTAIYIPGIFHYILDTARYFDHVISTTASIQETLSATKCLLATLIYLLRIVVRAVTPEGYGIPSPYDGYENALEPFSHERAPHASENHGQFDSIIDTCGDIMRMVNVRFLRAEHVSVADTKDYETFVVGYTYIIAIAARRRERTIRNYPEYAIQILAKYAGEPERHVERFDVSDRFMEWSWFCLACIFRPDHQWNYGNGGPKPIFQVNYDNFGIGSLIRSTSEEYFPIGELLNKLCDGLNAVTEIRVVERRDRVIRRMEMIFSIVHGIAAVHDSGASLIVRHPQFLGILVQKMTLLSDFEFCDSHVVFDEAVENIYDSLDNVWDKALFGTKLLPLLFQRGDNYPSQFLRTCILMSQWHNDTEYREYACDPQTPVPKTPITPFMIRLPSLLLAELTALKLIPGHNLNYTLAVAGYPESCQMEYHLEALWKAYSTSTFGDDIRDAARGIAGSNLYIKEMVMRKAEALRNDISQIHNIVIILGH